jgi:hypothetical protein
MNPLKCAFTVQSGLFLGFMVHHRGIEIEPKKIKAILNMPPPSNLNESLVSVAFGHGGTVDLGPRRWEGSVPCFEGFILSF